MVLAKGSGLFPTKDCVYLGFICSERDSSYTHNRWQAESKDLEVLKLKIDIKLCELGYLVDKLGV